MEVSPFRPFAARHRSGIYGPLDDAALVRPPGSAPLAFTVDFITPIVDDPYDFGAIAAANSLSDVYAMGGEPTVALAICGFPADQLPLHVLQEIFRGGRDKAAEAGCAIVGGPVTIEKAGSVSRHDPPVPVGDGIAQTLCVSGGMHLRRHFRRDLCWTCHENNYD